MSQPIQASQFNISKVIQNISLVALGILIISLPIQIHIFSQSNSVNTPVIVSGAETKEETKDIVNQDFDKNSQLIQTALEVQKTKVTELKFPKIVVKPITPVAPAIIPAPITPKPQVSSDPNLQELKELIAINCSKYSCNPDQLVRVMMCESGGTNHRDTFYKGPFQFLASTFYANAKRLDIQDADVLDARQQVQVASYMFGIGQGKQWGCK